VARTEALTIDLDSLTPAEWDTVRRVAAQGGVTGDLLPLVNLANPPVQVMAGLVFVTMRRDNPRVTFDRCVRLALAYQEANNGV
jgi:hypothetical protein